MGSHERERTLGPRCLVAEGAVGACRFRFSLRDALPIDEWPADVRARAIERIGDDPELLAHLRRGQRLLELVNPDDSSDDLEIAVASTDNALSDRFISQLPDLEAPGARQTFVVGVTGADVHSVRWEPEGGSVHRCETLPVPGDPAHRAFLMAVPPVGCGHLAALAADGDILETSSLCQSSLSSFCNTVSDATEIQRLRDLPTIGAGELPKGGRWMLRGGMVDEYLGHWLTREPQGGGGGGVMPVMGQDEVIRVNSVAGRAGELQVAVGQLAKNVEAVQAFDEQGILRVGVSMLVP